MANFFKRQGISKILLTLFFSIALIMIAVFAVQILQGYWRALFGASKHKASEYVTQAVVLVVALLVLIIVGKVWSFLNQRYEEDKQIASSRRQAVESAPRRHRHRSRTRPALTEGERAYSSETEASASLSIAMAFSARELAASHSLELLESWSLSEQLSGSREFAYPSLSEREWQNSLAQSQSELTSLREQEIAASQMALQQAYLASEQDSLSLSEAIEYQIAYHQEQAQLSAYRHEQEQSQNQSLGNSQRKSQYFSESLYYSERERENQAYSVSLAQSQSIHNQERRQISESFSLSYLARVESESIQRQQEREVMLSDQARIESTYNSESASSAALSVPSAIPTLSASSVSTGDTVDFDALIKKIEHLLADDI